MRGREEWELTGATIGLATVGWVLKVEGEHAEHTEHIKHEHGGHLPEVPAYPYMNKRAKPFPWGMNSLFFNPEVCPLLDSLYSFAR